MLVYLTSIWDWVTRPENADIVNGSFEAIGAVGAWINVWIYLKHRVVHGVFWPMTMFYSAWGLWNLVYYSALDQWVSFYAGIILTSGSILWVLLVIWDKWWGRKIRVNRHASSLPPEVGIIPSQANLEM